MFFYPFGSDAVRGQKFFALRCLAALMGFSQRTVKASWQPRQTITVVILTVVDEERFSDLHNHFYLLCPEAGSGTFLCKEN